MPNPPLNPADLPSSDSTDSTDIQDDAVIGRVFRISIVIIASFALLVGGGYALSLAFQKSDEPIVRDVVIPTERTENESPIPSLPLTSIASEAGVTFVHETGRGGEKLLPETMGSGVAVFDYNGDGHQDLLFVNAQPWPWDADEGERAASTCRLYVGDGTGKFDDVTAASRLDQFPLYGMGVAVGDYDADGWIDVYLTAVGANRLLRNVEGVFEDVTALAGTAGGAEDWSSSAGFVDYNRDGRLDLVVCNYVTWSRDADLAQSFTLDGESRAYGPPVAFSGSFPKLFRNDGEGKFTDVSADAGLEIRNNNTAVPLAKSLGLVPADIDGDGWLDLVIVNDTVRNFLFLNQQDGTFQEVGETYNIAYDQTGNARGGMGADAAWLRDGQVLAVGIGNFANEASALYVARPGRPQFVDAAMATGLGPPTRQGLTFGLFFFDVDLDGRLDLLGANGHLEEEIQKTQSSQRYEQPPQLFWNAGRTAGSELVAVPVASTGEAFAEPMVGRGSAFGDFDEDGDLDFVITCSGGPPKLFRNDQATGHHYVRLRLHSVGANRNAIGAVARLQVGDRIQLAQVMPTRGYLSQSELPITFGLGSSDAVDSLTITWPDGTVEPIESVMVDATNDITQSRSEQ